MVTNTEINQIKAPIEKQKIYLFSKGLGGIENLILLVYRHGYILL